MTDSGLPCRRRLLVYALLGLTGFGVATAMIVRNPSTNASGYIVLLAVSASFLVLAGYHAGHVDLVLKDYYKRHSLPNRRYRRYYGIWLDYAYLAPDRMLTKEGRFHQCCARLAGLILVVGMLFTVLVQMGYGIP